VNLFKSILAVGHDEDFRPPFPAVPTRAAPGSLEKIEVLRMRIERGQELFHDADERTLARVESSNNMGHIIIQMGKQKSRKS